MIQRANWDVQRRPCTLCPADPPSLCDRWLCLTCGIICCGRASGKEGLSHVDLHSQAYPNHCVMVSLDTYRYDVFCSRCDDMVALKEIAGVKSIVDTIVMPLNA